MTAAHDELAKSYSVQATMARTLMRAGRSWGAPVQDRLRHQAQQILELRHDRAPASEQMTAKITIDEHGEEPARLAAEPIETLRPGQREEARRQERDEERPEEPAATPPPDDPTLERPAEREEHETHRDLVRRQHIVLGLERPHHERGGLVRHDVIDETPEGQRQAEHQREPLAETVAQPGRGAISPGQVRVGQAGELEVLDVALEPGAQGRRPIL